MEVNLDIHGNAYREITTAMRRSTSKYLCPMADVGGMTDVNKETSGAVRDGL